MHFLLLKPLALCDSQINAPRVQVLHTTIVTLCCQLPTCLQRGRQEFDIGVAYNKVGQKYPNQDIFETWEQKARSWDGQMTGWPEDRIVEWPDNQKTRWPDGQMIRWTEDLMARSLDDQITRRPDDQMARWPDGQMIRWLDGQRTGWPEDHMARSLDGI